MTRFDRWLDAELTDEERDALDRRVTLLTYTFAVVVVLALAGIAIIEGVRQWSS